MIIERELERIIKMDVKDIEDHIRNFCEFDEKRVLSWRFSSLNFINKLISAKGEEEVYLFILMCHELLRRHENNFKSTTAKSATAYTFAKNALFAIGGMDEQSDTETLTYISLFRSSTYIAKVIMFNSLSMLILCDYMPFVMKSLISIAEMYPKCLDEVLLMSRNEDLVTRIKFEYKLSNGVGICM